MKAIVDGGAGMTAMMTGKKEYDVLYWPMMTTVMTTTNDDS